ncbi:MAG: hypothetical protein IJI47_03945 [Eubacterium sp.]|nr:hypothetical protein [Eubacterium sp.]MBR0412699.1 hypothetical protein [Eubacterium sp.]
MKFSRLTACISLIAALCILASSITVFGANSDYLSEAKWVRAAGVKTEEINKTSVNNRLTGTAAYIKDNDTLTFYNKFSLSESSMNYDGGDDVRVQYEISAKEGLYTFSVTENGMEDEFGGSQEVIDVGCNFYNDAATCKVLTYAQYNGSSTQVAVRVFLFINNCRYLIFDSVKLKVPEKTTTKKQTTTKKAKTTKKKSATTRSKKRASKSGGKNSNQSGRQGATEHSTKFDMHFDDESSAKVKKSTKAKTTAAAQNTATVAEHINAMSNRSLVMLICGIALIIAGVLILFYAIGYSKAAKKNRHDNTDEEQHE